MKLRTLVVSLAILTLVSKRRVRSQQVLRDGK